MGDTGLIELDPERMATLARTLPLGRFEASGVEQAIGELARALAEVAAPELETSFIAPGGFRQDFAGIDGYREGWLDWLATFDSYETSIEGARAGRDTTLLLTEQRGTPRGGGPLLENRSAVVVFWSDDRITRLEFHLDRDAAERAADIT